MEKLNKIEKLIEILNHASEEYYNGHNEFMSNYEWDKLFEELLSLEKETGIVLPNSPTQKVGAETIKGTREKHEFPALSLAKTKSVNELVKWASEKPIWMSWKLDGCTLVATYDNGNLTKLLTRGNGTEGTNITHIAEAIDGIPSKIKYLGHMVVRGEALISYGDFERINDEIEDEDEKFANPRNLASGTLNLDDIKEIKARNVQFKAFTLVHVDAIDGNLLDLPIRDMSSWEERMNLLSDLGFMVVEHEACTSPNEIEKVIDSFTKKVPEYEFPVDGLVICYDDFEYSQTGSVTGHHATRAGFAFKWEDKPVSTKVTSIDYTTTKMGYISQVAVFEPVEIAGTTVSRAVIPNMNYRSALDIKVGDRIDVIKANLIIPQIVANHDKDKNRTIHIVNDVERYGYPDICPCCGEKVGVHESNSGTMTLICTNPFCSARLIRGISHFCSKESMDIEGLSEAKIKFLVNHQFILDASWLYFMANEYKTTGTITNKHGESLATFDGWGEKSVKNLVDAIEKSKKTTFLKFIHGMNIPNVGIGQAKLLAPIIAAWMKKLSLDCEFSNLIEGLCAMVTDGYDFTQINGIGPVIANSLTNWIDNYLNDAICRHAPNSWANEVLNQIEFVDNISDYLKETPTDSAIAGKTFVITGDVHIFKNRKELQAKIEELGGKATGSVTSKTDFLINNDVESTSGKNKKAKELHVPIISEKEFMELAKLEM